MSSATPPTAPPVPAAPALIPPVALTIAGSDSGGGAGIQADLRTFAFLKVHGTSALTCVTAQNTLGVSRVAALEPDMVVAQIQAVMEDIGVQALKTGMLLNADIMEAVGEVLGHHPTIPWVLDPVMVSRTGAKLMDDRAIATLEQLIPRATIVTPNRYEAEILSGVIVTDRPSQAEAAQRIADRYPGPAVLVKGGGLGPEHGGVDWWLDGSRSQALETRQVETRHTHGTGCTLSAAIAAYLAQGLDPWTATQRAKVYVTAALHHALAIGQGQGPVGHFFPLL
ncbi:MAG: bifunctional hydroxymethylpyrimidine kinase/phosphomethylpyrimidine kinase [Prochlorothrix sp.]|nr:bifunctional hydroxymethylpyrimidine kinase/phosphomethylpyrimidine kinase [Prochlorothrix sp.]